MQEKVVFDTGIYIDLFNRGLHRDEFDGFQKIMYLVHPVLHELWIGAKGAAEAKHLTDFGNHFIRLGRLVQPQPATQLSIGRTCRKLRLAGALDPKHPRIYNDISIALLARQIGATVVTHNPKDFRQIRQLVDFRYRGVHGRH